MYGSKMGLEQNKDISMDEWKLENMKTFWMNYKPLSLKLHFSLENEYLLILQILIVLIYTSNN